MFSRFFHQRAARGRSPAEEAARPHGSRLGNAVRSVFRRVFRRRHTRVAAQPREPSPIRVDVEPIHVDMEPAEPLPTARRPSTTASDASSRSIRLHEEPSEPGESIRSRSQSRVTLILGPNARHDSSALNRFRDELIGALAMALLDHQEVRSAEQDLTLLQRRENVCELQQSLLQIQEQYRADVREIVAGRRIEDVPDYEFESLGLFEGRLIMARQMYAIEAEGVDLLSVRARHGEAAPETIVQSEVLDRQVLLLGRICHVPAIMDQLIQFERTAAIATSPGVAVQYPLHELGLDYQELYRARALEIMNMTPLGNTALLSSIAFKIKCQTLRLNYLQQRTGGKLELIIRREYMLSDSRNAVMAVAPSDLRRRLVIKYQGEDGNDFGGLARDWLCDVSQRVVQQLVATGALRPAANDPAHLQIGTCPRPAPEIIREFEFLGRLTGLALFHSKIIDVSFVEPVYKALLSLSCSLADLAAIDRVYHASLVDVMTSADVESYGLAFCVDYPEGNTIQTFNLVNDGDQRPVTNANRDEYIDLVVKWIFGRSIERQLDALRKGLSAVLDPTSLSLLNPRELSELTAGMPTVNLDEWRTHTVHENGYTADSPTVRWFWQALASFSPAKQCQVLKFVTGASRAPAQGFGSLVSSSGQSCFSLYRNEALDSLPVGHTCINRLDLPAYRSYDALVAKLTTAIEETEGFGIV